MNIPKHIALILDGNGRWAKKRGLSRSQGHEAGFNNLFDVIKDCKDLGISFVTCYAFSTENWNRPKKEVAFLMDVPVKLFERERKRLIDEDIKVRFIGRRDRIPTHTLKAIEKTEKLTEEHQGIEVLIAFDYGGRDEITRAFNKAIDLGNQVTESIVEALLDTTNAPRVDLLIRTSGEERLSNFMLWQVAYAEFVFTDTYWPDFSKNELLEAINEYNRRNRRFGSIKDEN